MKLKIQCGRCSDDTIRFQIIDESSRVQFVSFQMTMAQFGTLVSCDPEVEVDATVRGLNRVGTIAEHKQEIVPVPDGPWESRKERAAEALKPFEIDGWSGNVSDATNAHRQVSFDRENLSVNYRVTFRRHVRADTGLPVID